MIRVIRTYLLFVGIISMIDIISAKSLTIGKTEIRSLNEKIHNSTQIIENIVLYETILQDIISKEKDS